MASTLLVTGAAGMIGRDLVPYLFAHSDADLVLLLHRRGKDLDESRLLKQYFGLPASPRLRIVWGDVSQSDLGLSREDRQCLTRSVTHVLHAAASTHFDRPLQEAFRINTQGTHHVVVFALACRRLRQFGYVSTAYVSGRRTGIIREHELHHAHGFVNTYEESKYEAESFLRAVGKILPVAVYRLSTVFGDSRTGAVGNMTAPHHAMKMMYLGLASIIPGLPEYRVDLIPADYAAMTVGRLFLDRFQPGETFHVTASPEKSCTLPELIDRIYELFAEMDPAWSHRYYPRPVLSSREAFELFTRSVQQTGNPFLTGVMRAVERFAHQLTYPKTFDRTNIVQALPAYDDEMPDLRQYAHKVVRYCLQTQWGSHAA